MYHPVSRLVRNLTGTIKEPGALLLLSLSPPITPRLRPGFFPFSSTLPLVACQHASDLTALACQQRFGRARLRLSLPRFQLSPLRPRPAAHEVALRRTTGSNVQGGAPGRLADKPTTRREEA